MERLKIGRWVTNTNRSNRGNIPAGYDDNIDVASWITEAIANDLITIPSSLTQDPTLYTQDGAITGHRVVTIPDETSLLFSSNQATEFLKMQSAIMTIGGVNSPVTVDIIADGSRKIFTDGFDLTLYCRGSGQNQIGFRGGSGSLASPANVVAGENLGEISFAGFYNGSDRTANVIRCKVDNIVGSTVNGRLEFNVNSSTALVTMYGSTYQTRVHGQLRVDAVGGTATTLTGRDASGIITTTTVGTGLSLTTGTLSVSSYLPYRSASTTDTLLLTDGVVNYTAGTFNATLPAASGATGKYLFIRNSGAGTVTLLPNGADTINGGASIPINTTSSVTVVCDGVSNWVTI